MSNPPRVQNKCGHCGGEIAAGNRFCPFCGSDVSGEQASLATAQMSAPTKILRPEFAQEEQLEHLRQATLGEYEVYGELGRGGMATVFLAHDIALDRKVAIKVMSPSLVHGEGMVERFKREARTAASLSHPNIIPVYAVRETDRILYFVMKFVQGRPLDSIIKELGPLPIPMLRTILSQVGGAFGYAHRRGIVHRDIKPANIMIDDEGWAVVTDFGIAKVSESQGLTMTGMTVGTPTYMSPEQCMAQEVTGASDQYSLGVVAYEMITGRPPFTGGSMMAIMYGHFNDPPPPIEEVRPDCPPELIAAVMRMLAKDPAKRWPTVEQAVAPFGTQPLAHDDPTRSQLVALARSGAARQALVAAQASVPASPVPRTRPKTAGASSALTARVAPPPKATGTARAGAGPVVASASRRSSRGRLIGGGVVAALLAGAMLYLAPWKHATAPEPPAATSSPPAASSEAPPGPAAETPAPAHPAPVASATTPAPVSEAPGHSKPQPAVPPPAISKRDQADYDVMKLQAIQARSHAVDAGASANELSAGDILRSQAETFANRGRYGDALKPISDATTSFALAASAAQARAASRTRFNPTQPPAPSAQEPQPARVAAASPAVESTAHPPASESAAKPPAPVAAAPAAAASAQPVDERAAVEQAIREYARALSAGDMAEVLRLYPGFPQDRRDGLEAYFKAGNALDTSRWRIYDIAVTGNSATAKIGGTTVTRDKKGKSTEQNPPAGAKLERGSGGWRILELN
jgi:serine/threonine protein kinase